jgi:hypothetical protein
VIAILQLLDVARHLADLILQALDAVQQIRWPGLGMGDSRGSQQHRQTYAQRDDAD